jgi:hypothetical protein
VSGLGNFIRLRMVGGEGLRLITDHLRSGGISRGHLLTRDRTVLWNFRVGSCLRVLMLLFDMNCEILVW